MQTIFLVHVDHYKGKEDLISSVVLCACKSKEKAEQMVEKIRSSYSLSEYTMPEYTIHVTHTGFWGSSNNDSGIKFHYWIEDINLI